MSDFSTIKIKRTNKTKNQLSSYILQYGEPLFVKNSDGSFLVLGSDGVTPINEEKWLAFVNTELASKNVYWQKDSQDNYHFIDEDGNQIAIESSFDLREITFKDADGQTTKTYPGSDWSVPLEITAEDVGAVSTEGSNVPTPDGSNPQSIANVEYVKSMHDRGYNVVYNTSSTTINCQWNTEYRLGDRSGDLYLNLPVPEANYASEIRICVKCPANGRIERFGVTPPPNYVILGMDNFSFKAGAYYEISMACIGVLTQAAQPSQTTYGISFLVNKILL